MRIKNLITIITLFMAFTSKATASDIIIIELKCNFKENPLGVETANPSLSWQLKSDKRNQFQLAYRILVSNTEGDVENIISDET